MMLLGCCWVDLIVYFTINKNDKVISKIMDTFKNQYNFTLKKYYLLRSLYIHQLFFFIFFFYLFI